MIIDLLRVFIRLSRGRFPLLYFTRPFGLLKADGKEAFISIFVYARY